MESDNIKELQELVRQAYGSIARNGPGEADAGCGCGCGPGNTELAKLLGYTDAQLAAAPAPANLGLGCGNPTAIAGLKEGEVVLDLGSGAGFDCFLAAGKVGPMGRVIGVDMTPEMIEQANKNAVDSGYANVEFRRGEIERLPVANDAVDVVISNCVINLSADKPRAFGELARVLKPGGRIAIADIALLKELPPALARSAGAYVGCVSGAIAVADYRAMVVDAGLIDVKVETAAVSACVDQDTRDPIGRAILDSLAAGETIADFITSVYVTGSKSFARPGKGQVSP